MLWFLLCFCVVFMFLNVSKKTKNWIGGGWGSFGLINPRFSRIFRFFYLDKTPKWLNTRVFSHDATAGCWCRGHHRCAEGEGNVGKHCVHLHFWRKHSPDVLCYSNLKGLAQAKIIKKSVILFWFLNMTIWCKHVHRLELQKRRNSRISNFWHGCQ